MGSTGVIKGSLSYRIIHTPFKDVGGGQWELDIEGVDGISILDETDSSRAGFGMGKAYGITVWDWNYNIEPQHIIYGSLNDAKSVAKGDLARLYQKKRQEQPI